MLIFGYGDGLYLSELDLWRAERVTAEHAWPFELPEPPQFAARIDGGTLLTDHDDAMEEFRDGGDRIVMWTLAPCGRRYDVLKVIETPAFRQWLKDVFGVTSDPR